MTVIKNQKSNTYEVRTYYKDWTGVRKQKTKRGFKRKCDAQEWERAFKLKENLSLDMYFEDFVDLYLNDIKSRIKYNTWLTKKHIVEKKILPYFSKKKLQEIKPSDIRQWQNTMMNYRNKQGEGYSQVYLKTIHNQLSAILNHAVNFYDLKSNAARKAGSMGKERTTLKVVAAAEIDKEKLEAFGKKYGIPEENLYQDFREMLKRDDIDEVEVCVHNNLHTSVATAVMAAGFDCYSEKPMAASYADAKILYDAQKKYGKKLAVQISSIYNPQTRIAKKMIEEGKLGKIYHARSVGHRRQGRPGYDMPFFSPDFINAKVGVHGPLFDLGIYHLAKMLYVLGMPELESVYGMQSCDYWTDKRIDKITNRTAPVEDLGVGLARFKGGLSMDIYEDWAMHMDDIGTSFVAGSNGGLKFLDVDTTGGPLAVPEGGSIVGGGALQNPKLEWFGVDEDGNLFENKLNCAIGDITGQQELMLHPEMEKYNDNQLQWYSYLRGELDDTTRIDSPYIAMQTAFLSEGVVLSSELGRSVTAEEIKAMSKSIALREQETPFGTIQYEFDEYKPE